jgi:hypothetical protein
VVKISEQFDDTRSKVEGVQAEVVDGSHRWRLFDDSMIGTKLDISPAIAMDKALEFTEQATALEGIGDEGIAMIGKRHADKALSGHPAFDTAEQNAIRQRRVRRGRRVYDGLITVRATDGVEPANCVEDRREALSSDEGVPSAVGDWIQREDVRRHRVEFVNIA